MTKVYEDRVVQTRCHSDTICDACGASCMKSCGVECGNLFASWGYDSSKDMVNEDYDFCESCFDKIVKQFVTDDFVSEVDQVISWLKYTANEHTVVGDAAAELEGGEHLKCNRG